VSGPPTQRTDLLRPVYLDECVDYNLAEALREQGFRVFTALDEDMAEQDDLAQLAFAASRGRLLITHNGRHFRRLHRSFLEEEQDHAGIIELPERPPFARLVIRATMMLAWIGMTGETTSVYYPWGQLQERLEGGYRLPGFTEEDLRLALGRV
jgi:hypothetical protein